MTDLTTSCSMGSWRFFIFIMRTEPLFCCWRSAKANALQMKPLNGAVIPITPSITPSHQILLAQEKQRQACTESQMWLLRLRRIIKAFKLQFCSYEHIFKRLTSCEIWSEALFFKKIYVVAHQSCSLELLSILLSWIPMFLCVELN